MPFYTPRGRELPGFCFTRKALGGGGRARWAYASMA